MDAEFTKRTITMQYTEIVYYRNGVEIGRERQYDDTAWDESGDSHMTEEEINDWSE